MIKQYQDIKETNIFWLGDIPSHWQKIKIKRLAKVKNGKDQKEISIEEGGYPAYGTGGIIGRVSEFLYDKDTVLLGRKGTIDRPQFITEPFWVVDTAFYTEINDDVNAKFFYYLSLKIPFELLQESSAVPSMTQEKLNNVFVCKPTLYEQNKIVEFLDYRTGVIDKLIAKKERLLDLLKEKRQAVINEAVTKGLDPNSKMKDSGIEWLGEVPEEWEVVKLRYLADITTGDKDTENREDVGEYPFFVRSQTIEKISSFTFDGEAILTAGDGVGVCKVWHYINGKFDFHQRVYMLSNFREITGKYLFHYIKENFIHDVLKLSAKSTVDSLRRPMFLDFPVLVPDTLEMQTKIVSYVEKRIAICDKSIEKLNTIVLKLREYRESIISEAVTGKIDLREWEPPNKNNA